jgi:hypothetical protein
MESPVGMLGSKPECGWLIVDSWWLMEEAEQRKEIKLL